MSEHLEQCAVIQYCKLKKILIFAIPNGTNIPSYKGRNKAKAEGLKKGVPDLFIPVPSKAGHHGLFIEMKKPKGKSRAGILSIEQEWWLNTLLLKGYAAEVCYGADEAIKTIEHYLINDINREIYE